MLLVCHLAGNGPQDIVCNGKTKSGTRVMRLLSGSVLIVALQDTE